jgi:hypothetical protein
MLLQTVQRQFGLIVDEYLEWLNECDCLMLQVEEQLIENLR